MKLLSVAGALSLALGFIGCEDANDPEYVVPAGNVIAVDVEKSIYTNQTFFDLSMNSVTGVDSVKYWDLSVQTYGDNPTVYLNTGKSLYAYKTTSANIDEAITIPETISWVYDDQGGDASKTAIGSWADGEVYLIGIKDLTSQNPDEQLIHATYKISFQKSGNDVVVKWADLTASTVVVTSATLKGSGQSQPYTYFSFSQAGKSDFQPPVQSDWDIELTPYTANVRGYAYLVNGILINRHAGVMAYKIPVASGLTNEEYTAYFEALNTDSVDVDLYSSEAHTIGYDWKKSGVDGDGNPTGDYVIRPNYLYMVKDADGRQYKLRVTNFYTGGNKGEVTFEYALLATPTK